MAELRRLPPGQIRAAQRLQRTQQAQKVVRPAERAAWTPARAATQRKGKVRLPCHHNFLLAWKKGYARVPNLRVQVWHIRVPVWETPHRPPAEAPHKAGCLRLLLPVHLRVCLSPSSSYEDSLREDVSTETKKCKSGHRGTRDRKAAGLEGGGREGRGFGEVEAGGVVVGGRVLSAQRPRVEELPLCPGRLPLRLPPEPFRRSL